MPEDLRAVVRWLQELLLLTRPIKMLVPELPQALCPILTDAELARIWRAGI